MFAQTQPDIIQQMRGGNYVFTYASGKAINMLPVGTDYFVVYSPNACINKWYVVRYRILPDEMHYIAAHKERELTVEEIAYFERLVKDRGSFAEVAPTGTY